MRSSRSFGVSRRARRRRTTSGRCLTRSAPSSSGAASQPGPTRSVRSTHAADDLAGCALIVQVLLELRDEPAPHDVHAIFTRAEETGLYGARLAAEDGLLPRDAYVVSVEASRALPGAESGRGIVVRAGDLHNTFSNEAERYLRVARGRRAERGVPSQRALLAGGT